MQFYSLHKSNLNKSCTKVKSKRSRIEDTHIKLSKESLVESFVQLEGRPRNPNCLTWNILWLLFQKNPNLCTCVEFLLINNQFLKIYL